jgi:S1-C subfamily serine protease
MRVEIGVMDRSAMARLTIRLAAALVTAPFLVLTAAASQPPDRTALSYDENVIINTACFAAAQQGTGAYDGCVRAQLAALEAHPSPDRSGLSAGLNQKIERSCDYQRRVGIAEYNDCVKKAMATPSATAAAAEYQFGPDFAKVFATGPDRPKQDTVAPVSLPLPSKLLTERPDHINDTLLSPAVIFKRVERSVFIVYATRSLADAKSRDIMFGSAVAVAEHFLLTNCHVVKDRPVIRIMRDSVPMAATLVASDAKADRCLLQSEGPALVPIAGVRPFKDLAVGERVFAIGAPVGLEHTLTQGLISGLRNLDGRNLVQTDAPLSPGNSGGGLFDESGNLIGITTLASRAGIQNLNFAVAASDYWEQR